MPALAGSPGGGGGVIDPEPEDRQDRESGPASLPARSAVSES
jgi:hypothetical protein